MKGEGVFGSIIASGNRITRNVTLGNVVCSLSSNKESVTSNNSVGGESRSLGHQFRLGLSEKDGTNLQQIKNSAGVKAGLLICGIDQSRLGVLVRLEGGGNINFETLGNLVINLEETTEDIGGSPSLGEGQAVFAVGIFCFELARDSIGLVVTITRDFEGDI